MGSLTKKAIGVSIGVVVLVVLIGLYIGLYLTSQPSSASAQTTGGKTHLYLSVVAAAATDDPHPTWVSYYAVDSHDGNWKHATTFIVPAHTLVQVTIWQFDSQTGLRNPFISQATGTVGGTFGLDGKTVQAIGPDTASHIFAIPEMGVSVPLMGIDANAKNPCGNAPCPLSNDHHTITFTFRTGGKGLFRWQCFVPCAAGYIQGFGGPMQTVGYMDGFIKVV